MSGFPEGLPSDVVCVTKKNGPEYNRYYFNDFYERLKTDFLISTPSKNARKILIILAILVAIIGLVVFFGNRKASTSINDNDRLNNLTTVDTYNKITTNQSYAEAKRLFINVAGRTPVYAATYTEDTPILIGLVNEGVIDGDMPDSKDIVSPNMSLIRYHNENGVWMKDFSKNITFERIIDEDDADIFCTFDDIPELYSASQQIYLYFHLYRYCGGNASADVTHDFIAINLMKGTYHFLEYVENLDSHYSDNGTLYKEKQYPKGIEDLLTNKFTEQGDLQKTNN